MASLKNIGRCSYQTEPKTGLLDLWYGPEFKGAETPYFSIFNDFHRSIHPCVVLGGVTWARVEGCGEICVFLSWGVHLPPNKHVQTQKVNYTLLVPMFIM